MQENWIIKIDKNLIIYWLFTTKSRCFFVWVDPNFRGALGLTWGQKWHSFVMLQNKKGISSKCLSLAQDILWLEIFFRGRMGVRNTNWERKSIYSTSRIRHPNSRIRHPNFRIRHPNSRIRHLNSTGVEISSVVEYIDLRSQYTGTVNLSFR